nr:zf-HC2 domain-containing protein [Deltaproteobacteria bacterium]
MNCKKVGKMLTAYISDESGGDERREIEAHIQICPSCQRELASLQATRETLGIWDELETPEELSQRFEVRLAEEVQKGETKSFIPFRWLSSPILGISLHSTKWIHISATVVCFITAVTLMFYILLSREERTLPETAYDYNSYKQDDVWVNFYISEHEKTLKHAALQEAAALSWEAPIRVPFRRENILYYDEISEESENLKGQSGLILKSESGWREEIEDETHEDVLSGEILTLEEARKSVSFDIIAPSVIRG